MGSDSDGDGDDGVQDALASMFSQKTRSLRKSIAASTAVVDSMAARLNALEREMAGAVPRETYAREMQSFRVEVGEASALSREVRSEHKEGAALLREELLRVVRSEISTGLAAQHAMGLGFPGAFPGASGAAGGFSAARRVRPGHLGLGGEYDD